MYTVSPVSNVSALTTQQLAKYAPSIYGNTPAEQRTDKYKLFSTADIIDKMEEVGFLPTFVMQNGGRNTSIDTRKHMVRFTHHSDIDAGIRKGERAEIILINSHDGSSAYNLLAGIYRLVCANGLVAVDRSFGGEVSIRHMGHTIDEVIDASLRIRNNISNVFDAIADMKRIRLTEHDAKNFAKRAAVVRFGEEAAKRGAIVHPERLLNARRTDDRDLSLWNVFNAVQENMIKGGETVMRRRMRPITNISANVKFNRELWEMAQSYRAAA